MKSRELIKELSRYPVFTVKDIASIANKEIGYAYTLAYRLKETGQIYKIEKGKYTLETDPFAIASWIAWPSYISGWAALSYHRLTEQLPFTIHVVTTIKRKRKTISFGNGRIEFLTVKKDRFFGFEKEMYKNKEIFVAEKEKAIIDAVATKKMTVQEASEIIESNRNKLSKRKLFLYGKIIHGLNAKLRALVNDKRT